MNDLTPDEIRILCFAMERASDAMSDEPDEFSAEEHSALDSLQARVEAMQDNTRCSKCNRIKRFGHFYRCPDRAT